MRVFRHHVIVQVFVCLLLSWAAADLLVPQLCSAEQSRVATAGGEDSDDCFCCCSHTETPVVVVPVRTDGVPVPVDSAPPASLAEGVPLAPYHPPVSA